jgi:hypothetical protein
MLTASHLTGQQTFCHYRDGRQQSRSFAPRNQLLTPSPNSNRLSRFAGAFFGSFRYFRLDGLGTIHNFAVVIGDIEVKNVLFSVHSGKSHNIEQTPVVLDGLYANGTPLPEMFRYVHVSC